MKTILHWAEGAGTQEKVSREGAVHVACNYCVVGTLPIKNSSESGVSVATHWATLVFRWDCPTRDGIFLSNTNKITTEKTKQVLYQFLHDTVRSSSFLADNSFTCTMRGE